MEWNSENSAKKRQPCSLSNVGCTKKRGWHTSWGFQNRATDNIDPSWEIPTRPGALVERNSVWRPFTHYAAKEYEASKTHERRKAASGGSRSCYGGPTSTVKAPDLADRVVCPPCRCVGISGLGWSSPRFTIARRWYSLLKTNDYLLVKNKNRAKHTMLGVSVETKEEGDKEWWCSTMSKHKDILKPSPWWCKMVRIGEDISQKNSPLCYT